jgi:hypothetical protein
MSNPRGRRSPEPEEIAIDGSHNTSVTSCRNMSSLPHQVRVAIQATHEEISSLHRNLRHHSDLGTGAVCTSEDSE